MKNKLTIHKHIEPDEHLRDILKSSYSERLKWLESALEFFARIKTKAKKVS